MTKGECEMRKGEARELVGMFATLAVLVTIGAGLSSVAPQLSEVAEVEPPVESESVEAPFEDEDLTTPVQLAPAEPLPTMLRIYEVIDSAEPSEAAPRLPVGVAVGI